MGPGEKVGPGERDVSLYDDDVYYDIRWRLKLEGETENMGVCTKERKGITAAVLMATPCTNSLGGLTEDGGRVLSPIFAFLREEFAEGCPKESRAGPLSSKAKMSTRARRSLPPRTPMKGSVGSPSLAETAAKGGRKGERNVVESTEEDAGTTNQYEAARLVSPQPRMSRIASQARMAHHSCPFAQNHEPLTLSVPAG